MNKRCIKKGHREKERTFQIYRQGSNYRVVAEKCNRTEIYCARCGEVLKTQDEFIMSFQGITLPSDKFEQLDTAGWVRI